MSAELIRWRGLALQALAALRRAGMDAETGQQLVRMLDNVRTQHPDYVVDQARNEVASMRARLAEAEERMHRAEDYACDLEHKLHKLDSARAARVDHVYDDVFFKGLEDFGGK